MSGICATCRGSSTQHALGGAEGCECYRCVYLSPVRCMTFDEIVKPAKPTKLTRNGRRRETLNAADDTPTQIAGGLRALPTAGTRRREAYDAIYSAGERGVIFDELVAGLSRTYSQLGPRVRELKADGHVVGVGTRRAASGARQDVWVASVWVDTEPPMLL